MEILAIVLVGSGLIIFFAFLAHWNRMRTCPRCGVRLNRGNVFELDDDESICVNCYAKMMIPEYYYEDK